MNVLIFSDKKNDLYLRECIKKIAGLHKGCQCILVSPSKVNDTFIGQYYKYTRSLNGVNLNKIEDISYEYVYLLDTFGSDVPRSIVRDILSKNIKSISLLKNNLEFSGMIYSGVKKTSKSIMVFPGPIFPIHMGSHQRAYGMIESLNMRHTGCDVMITSGNAKHSELSAELLKLIAPNVYTFKNNRKKIKGFLRFRRYIESKYRKLFGLKGAAPDLFEERISNKATESAKLTLKRLVKEKKYSDVIVNYAWMMPVIDYIDEGNVRITCDTHDVQYVRGKSNNKGEKRFFVSWVKEKRLEVAQMNRAEVVLAISSGDFVELKKTVKKSKVIKCVSGFDYAKKKIKNKGKNEPINFGFIGGRMDANVKALAKILEEWWPLIQEFSPDSKLFVAGSICGDVEIKQLCFLNRNVERLGFVDSIWSFYDKFDISLNPVVVVGGLNFKSIESMSAGKVLFTNDIGLRCLVDNSVIRSCEAPSDVIKALKTLDRDRPYLHSQKRLSQKVALENFSEGDVYNEFHRSIA
jgi:hypothetical protein